jgi:hypothetical protein
LRFEDEGSERPEIAVAVIKKPSKISITDSRYGGAVIVNPGKPTVAKI